ncbi:hypothetical protein GGR56DRAFT_495638 [Xylariaceae sp. FL0804]|nr:hypothetical protein GGR56DRAFT_495638 [Xylariaceae sp. FL0804]
MQTLGLGHHSLPGPDLGVALGTPAIAISSPEGHAVPLDAPQPLGPIEKRWLPRGDQGFGRDRRHIPIYLADVFSPWSLLVTFGHFWSLLVTFGHSDLLQLIFDYCNIDISTRRLLAECLSKLNIHSFTFQKIRAELRSPLIGISATSIEDLQRFGRSNMLRSSAARTPPPLKSLHFTPSIGLRAWGMGGERRRQ